MLFYVVSAWNDKVVILEQDNTFIFGFVCLVKATSQQNWATEIFFVNDLANKTKKFYGQSCRTSKNSFDVPVPYETQLSARSEIRQYRQKLNGNNKPNFDWRKVSFAQVCPLKDYAVKFGYFLLIKNRYAYKIR